MTSLVVALTASSAVRFEPGVAGTIVRTPPGRIAGGPIGSTRC